MLHVAAAGVCVAAAFGAVWYVAGDKPLPADRGRLFVSDSVEEARRVSPSAALAVTKSPDGATEAAVKLAAQLQLMCSALPVDPNDVRFLDSPHAFFSYLLDAVAAAQRRIVISALYIGVGEHSRRLAAALEQSVRDRPELELTLLLDCGRMRASSNIQTLVRLLALAAERPAGQVVLRLFQTPTPAGLLLEPLGRARELMGVLHTKIFVFDDDVLMTGANLSDDYFIDRIDRYAVFQRTPPLAAWYTRLAATVAAVSHPLSVTTTKGDKAKQATVAVLPNASGYNPTIDHCGFIKACTVEFQCFIDWVVTQRRAEPLLSATTGCTTFVFPTLQFGRIGIHHDEAVAEVLLSFTPAASDHDSSWKCRTTVASPYLNFLTEYVECIRRFADVDHTYNVVTSGPSSNGWKKTTGLTSLIPSFYQQLQRSFFWMLRDFGCGDHVRILEFCADGKTMHSKGIWLSAVRDGSSLGPPFVTAIGSSNYGCRSVHKDLESEIVVITTDLTLRRAIASDLERLESASAPVDPARFVGDGDGRFQPVVSVMASVGLPYL